MNGGAAFWCLGDSQVVRKIASLIVRSIHNAGQSVYMEVLQHALIVECYLAHEAGT